MISLQINHSGCMIVNLLEISVFSNEIRFIPLRLFNAFKISISNHIDSWSRYSDETNRSRDRRSTNTRARVEKLLT